MMIKFDDISLNNQLQFALLADEMTGVIAYDRSKNHMPVSFETPGAPSWSQLATGIPTIVLPGDKALSVPGGFSTALNFTTEDFSMMMWVNVALSATDMLMTQGVTDSDGWEWFLTDTVNTMSFRLNQGGSHSDIAAVGCFTQSIWQCVAITRTGAVGQFYVNGIPKPTIGSLSDAVSVAGGDALYIGKKATGNYLAGSIACGFVGPKIWSRKLSDNELYLAFLSDKSALGV
jgi:hypothetical protein